MPSKKQNRVNAKAITRFQREIRAFYKGHKRSFPWRDTKDPYRVFVSEIMLQQTQVDRVVPKYEAFIRRFPNWKRLAEAPLKTVLTHWSGLGYNRRAKFLHQTAREVMSRHAGAIPADLTALRALPGVGDYTANAVLAFAFNKKARCIETNIRTVMIHSFFNGHRKVTDDSIKHVLERTLPRRDFRSWYYALMDYGTHLKKTVPHINKKSFHYVRQSPFKGSNREVRGAILKALIQDLPVTIPSLQKQFRKDSREIASILNKLIEDNLIIKKGRTILLP